MNKLQTSCVLIAPILVLMLVPSPARGQDNSGDSSAQPAAASTPQTTPQEPVPAYGPDNQAPSITENPPISGLDLPSLGPHAAPLSYLQAGAHLSQSVDSNVQDSLGGSSTRSVSRAMGSLELQRLWRNYALSLDYVGGAGYYNAAGIGLKQIEELGIDQRINWKRGQLGVRDSFSYEPEGTFGGTYGSLATSGAAFGGQSTFFSGNGLGSLGQVPRIMNLSLVDLVEHLTPRSSVTLTGGYGFVHFLEDDLNSGTSFIGNSQVSAQVGYNRVLGPHDQAALVYGFQGFRFSTGVTFQSHVPQIMWGHRISGRMDFLVGAGPQFTQIKNQPTVCQVGSQTVACLVDDLRISGAGRASLRYRFPKVSLDLTYEHLLTSGSGFFAGAESDIVRLGASRPLGRVWEVFTDIGYSRHSRVTPLTPAQVLACQLAQTMPNAPPCTGVNANKYQYGFAGAGVHRMFGRNFRGFASFQFNDLAFDSSFCVTGVPCNRISQRSTGAIGLDWTPRPIRLD